MILLVTAFHEVGETQKVLAKFHRILKLAGKLVIVEMIKRGFLVGPPVQDTEALKAEVKAGNFKLEQMRPYKTLDSLLCQNHLNVVNSIFASKQVIQCDDAKTKCKLRLKTEAIDYTARVSVNH